MGALELPADLINRNIMDNVIYVNHEEEWDWIGGVAVEVHPGHVPGTAGSSKMIPSGYQIVDNSG